MFIAGTQVGPVMRLRLVMRVLTEGRVVLRRRDGTTSVMAAESRVDGTAAVGRAEAMRGAAMALTLTITLTTLTVMSMLAVSTVAEVLPAQSGEALLLGNLVDIRTDEEGNEVEEGHPGSLGQELLGKGQAKGRRKPADLHDLPEADTYGCLDLLPSLGAGDDGHGNKIYRVLNRGHLDMEKNNVSHSQHIG